MKITIDDYKEAMALAKALYDYIYRCLEAAGYLRYNNGENQYYTSQRLLLHELERFMEQ